MSDLLNPLRRILPPTIKNAMKRRLGIPETRLHADWSLLQPIGPQRQPHLVLDVGAHRGWFFRCWLDWCPLATVHAFEPYPQSFQHAQRVHGQDPRVTIHPLGVGAEEGTLPFNVLPESLVSNSFLQPDSHAWDRVAYVHGDVQTIEVPVTTLDIFCAQHQITSVYLLKIDVQGFEMQVLKGAEQILPVVDHIMVESGIQRLYANAPRVNDVFEFLTARGFHLMAQRSWHRGNHVLMESDLLFRRNGLEGPIDPTINRVVEAG